MRLRYWIQTALQSGLLVVFGSLVYGLMMVLMGIEGGMRELLPMASMFLLLFGAGMSILMCTTTWKLNLPVALNFGSTRQEAFWGMQCYRLIYSAVVFVISAVMCVLAGEDGFLPWELFAPLGIGVLLLTGALGTVLGVLGFRFGKTAQIVIGVLSGLLLSCGMIAGVVMAIIMDEMVLVGTDGGFCLFPVVSMVIYGLSIIPECRTIYKFAVKL